MKLSDLPFFIVREILLHLDFFELENVIKVHTDLIRDPEFENTWIAHRGELLRDWMETNHVREIEDSCWDFDPWVRSTFDDFLDGSMCLNQVSHLPVDFRNPLCHITNDIVVVKDSLIHVYISRRNINVFPIALTTLDKLETLHLHINQICEIPEDIGRLGRLRSFNISSNRLTYLPNSISSLSNLIELNIGNNLFTTFPKQIAVLSNLTALSVSYNQLSIFPEEILKLKKLMQLYLTNNSIHHIPKWINQLSKLNVLHLSGNPIETLPNTITKLPLKQLYIMCESLRVNESLLRKVASKNAVIHVLDESIE